LAITHNPPLPFSLGETLGGEYGHYELEGVGYGLSPKCFPQKTGGGYVAKR